MRPRTFVLVGAGVAAATAADTLRSLGFDGRVVMIGRESDPPYNRPTLSKERLRGEIDDAQALFHPIDYYKTKEIELLLEHTVSGINVVEHTIHFANGEKIAYDSVLIAIGAELRRCMAPGSDLPGIYYLRSLQDDRDLTGALKPRPRVLVLGTGFIGCEVAASARTLGCQVTLVGNTPPLSRVLGPELGAVYEQYHRGQGVNVRIGTFVERFEGNGRLERAKLFDGSSVECDVAVMGIGVEPSLEIVRHEPIQIDDGGILVDEFARTGAPGVFAVGDVAFSWNPRYARRFRFEHFDNAQLQAVAAAKAMLGPSEPYNPIPSFWSDQYGYNLQYRGYAQNWDSVVVRGNQEEASFSAFYLKDAAVQAICSVNRYKENYAARRLLGKPVDPKILEDDQTNVKDVRI